MKSEAYAGDHTCPHSSNKFLDVISIIEFEVIFVNTNSINLGIL